MGRGICSACRAQMQTVEWLGAGRILDIFAKKSRDVGICRAPREDLTGKKWHGGGARVCPLIALSAYPGSRGRCGIQSARTASSTSSAWPGTLTLDQMRAMHPSAPIRNVLRSIPMNVLPYICFSRQTP